MDMAGINNDSAPINLSDDVLAITVIGCASTGKSSVIRALQGKFNDNELMTIGAQFSINTIELDNIVYRIRICDIAGQTSFSFVRQNFMRNSMGAIVIFDITRPESFLKINEWIFDYLSANNFDITLPILLVGNKSDLEENRKVRITDVNRLLRTITSELKVAPNIIGYIETSAKNGEGVHAAFQKLSTFIVAR